ncbi:hypothetical protein BGX31_002803 [Mortierella sp. GBA43]|nr:hypothetical protein BGX31_002803 [Mortierella sp. GBA43]
MKFIVAAIATLALATTLEASHPVIRFYTETDRKGSCAAITIVEYRKCYDVVNFAMVKSAAYVNGDPYNDKVSVSFFEGPNCGGKYTRRTGEMPFGKPYNLGNLGQVSGFVESIWVVNAITKNDEGDLAQTYPMPDGTINFGPC